MALAEKRTIIRWAIILLSVIALILFLWSVSSFFNQLKKEERKKMEIWVQAQTELIQDENPDPILLSIIQKNTSTPMILFSAKDSFYSARNINRNEELSQEDLKALTETYELQYKPIDIHDKDESYGTVYYGNSSFINKTKYFPVVIIVVVLLFTAILYYFYNISKSNEQNKLWAGMAKETAHQIGTPLSSLVGWIELLKTEKVDPDYLEEMEKDINRLRIITDRFSKIGSIPTLQKMDVVQEAAQSFDYLESRNSKLIKFSIDKPDTEIYVRLNRQLLSWTIENLVKNAADACKGKGKVALEITEDEKWAYLRLSDTGKGIAKKDFRRIFKPGETTKKRGWGLGLSLAKRIIEEYHNGKIKVLKSEIGKGTTFEIKLLKNNA